MVRQKITLSIDEDLHAALKKLPRDVSISDIINLLLKFAVEEVKSGREMTDKEVKEWLRKDPKRLEVQMYMKEKLGPYIDMVDEVIGKFKKEKNGKK